MIEQDWRTVSASEGYAAAMRLRIIGDSYHSLVVNRLRLRGGGNSRMKILLGSDDLVGQWVADMVGGCWIRGSGRCFGLLENDKLVAGVAFDNWNGASIQVHIAAEPGWKMNKALAGIMADYAFNQLKLQKVIGPIGEAYPEACWLAQRAGFVLEATLSDAHPSGKLYLYSMHRTQATKWLRLAERKPWNEFTQSAAPARLRSSG